MKDAIREEYAIILDFLPYGYPFDTSARKFPVAQAIGKKYLILLELIPKKGVTLQPNEEVYMGEGKRDKVHHILGKISVKKLTETAKIELEPIINKLIDETEGKYIDFFNKAMPINTRRHQIELLPGIGKKHRDEILEERSNGVFKSFEDLKNRVRLMPDPKKLIIKRILMELSDEDKYKLFVGVSY